MIYAVLIEDRHTDPAIELYLTRERAVARCQEIFEERTEGEREDWPDIMAQLDEMNKKYDDVRYFSTEGDSARVLELKDPR